MDFFQKLVIRSGDHETVTDHFLVVFVTGPLCTWRPCYTALDLWDSNHPNIGVIKLLVEGDPRLAHVLDVGVATAIVIHEIDTEVVSAVDA